MARIDVRVDVPANPDQLAALIGKIIAQDAALNKATPGSSPLDEDDVKELQDILAKVQPDRDLIAKLQAQTEAAEQRSLNALGMSQGQTVRTEGTGLFLVTKVRDTLLAAYKGREKEAEGFGFPVVITARNTPQRQPNAKSKPVA